MIVHFQVYYLEVYIREYSWLVERRYREFFELHEKVSELIINVRHIKIEPYISSNWSLT